MISVKIDIINLTTGDVVQSYTRHWLNNAARDDLIRKGVWAFSNGHGIQIYNVSDTDAATNPARHSTDTTEAQALQSRNGNAP